MTNLISQFAPLEANLTAAWVFTACVGLAYLAKVAGPLAIDWSKGRLGRLHYQLARAAVTAPDAAERARRRADAEWLRNQMDPTHPPPITQSGHSGPQNDGEPPDGPATPDSPTPTT